MRRLWVNVSKPSPRATATSVIPALSAVRTASAEQVRQPLYTSGVDYWRHFAAELEPLRRALGDCLERFE